jgi:hypothetical protein
MALRINAVNPLVFGAFRAGNRQGPQKAVYAERERRFRLDLSCRSRYPENLTWPGSSISDR